MDAMRMKTGSAAVVSREMQINTAMGLHVIPIRTAANQKDGK